jgi:predicted transcriptional regulator
MSYERITNVLALFGLSEEEVRMYLSLAVGGPKSLEVIQNNLQLEWGQIIISIQKLEEKKLVHAYRGQYNATQFEKVLDIIIDTDLAQALDTESNKDKILKQWRAYASEKTNPKGGDPTWL